MSTQPTIEERLTTLENAVKEIQERLGPPPSAERWWEKIPPIEDDLREAFHKMVEYGRAFRNADHPLDDLGEQS